MGDSPSICLYFAWFYAKFDLFLLSRILPDFATVFAHKKKVLPPVDLHRTDKTRQTPRRGRTRRGVGHYFQMCIRDRTQSGQGVLQKGGGVPAWYAEALGEVIFRPADALPVEVIVGLTDRVRQRPVGAGGDHPGISIHDGINTGQFPVIVQGNGDIGLRLRIEVDDRLCVGSASRRRTAGEQR